MALARKKMQTRSGNKRPPLWRHQKFKEVRISMKNRNASAIDCPQLQNDAPASKKQKSSKAVRFDYRPSREDGVSCYKGNSPQDSQESRMESSPSEQLLDRLSIEVDQFPDEAEKQDQVEVLEVDEAEKQDQVEVLEVDEAEQCMMDTAEDSNVDELMNGSMAALEEATTVSLIDDFHNQEKDNFVDQNTRNIENNDHQLDSEKREDAFIDIASPDSSPTDLADKDEEYKQRYLNLKATAWHWASTYFPPPTSIPGSSQPPLNLTDLCHSSPQLMEYANYISVCTDTSTWEDVFDKQRTFLVYSILGKLIDVHIFGHEMFGATDEQLHTLRAADEESIMDDAFHRQTQRAEKISTLLTSHPHRLPENLLPTLSALVASTVDLLSPLLTSPTPTPTNPSAPSLKTQSSALKTTLTTILLHATLLSLSICLFPQKIYTWTTHPAPGRPYSSATMHILDHTPISDLKTPQKTRIITMAGWPSCIAYTPTPTPTPTPTTPNEKSTGPVNAKVLGRAEVLVQWGTPPEPFAVRSPGRDGEWLGRRLRGEMRGRVEKRDRDRGREERMEMDRRDREERYAVGGAGMMVGVGLAAVGWAVQSQSQGGGWGDAVRGVVGF